MKSSSVLAVVPLLAATALAQDQINATRIAELTSGFQALKLNQLAALAAGIANSSAGIALLTKLTNLDEDVTIFAPTDDALKSARQEVLSNADLLSQVISYHVVPGAWNSSSFAKTPAHSILPTLLTNASLVQLEGGRAQVLAATLDGDKIELLNQEGTVRVTNAGAPPSGSFHILPIDGILQPPGTIEEVAKANNLTAVVAAVQQAGLTKLVDSAKGITVFAPNDQALTAALGALGGQIQNATLIQTILQNHIINGTSVYSTQLNKEYTSAAGEKFKFTVDGNVVTVHSGDDSAKIQAKIVKSDVLAANGVLHVIDAVLINLNRDDAAASSAYESATSAASSAATQTPTGGIGGNGNGNGSGSGDGDNAAGRVGAAWTVFVGAAVVGVAMGVCAL